MLCREEMTVDVVTKYLVSEGLMVKVRNDFVVHFECTRMLQLFYVLCEEGKIRR